MEAGRTCEICGGTGYVHCSRCDVLVCPNCHEYKNGEKICLRCGGKAKEVPQPEQQSPGIRPGKVRTHAAALIVIGFLLYFLVGFIGFLVIWIGFSILLKGSSVFRFGISFVLALTLLIPAAEIDKIRDRHQREREAEEQRPIQAKKEAERAANQKAHIEKLRASVPDNYEKGLVFFRQGKYAEALATFRDVAEADPYFRDVSAQIQSTLKQKEKLDAKMNAQRAKESIERATKLGNSESCWDMSQAIESLEEVKRLDPATDVSGLVYRIRERKLLCFEGDGSLQMAILIFPGKPVKLHVSIKNKSSLVRHANPNFFTLVTQNDESFPYSGGSFPAVELQPGTETSGELDFDTYSAPKTLIYKDFMGGSLSRDFPVR